MITKIEGRFGKANREYFVIKILSGIQNGGNVEIKAHNSTLACNTYILDDRNGFKKVGLALNLNQATENNTKRGKIFLIYNTFKFNNRGFL